MRRLMVAAVLLLVLWGALAALTIVLAARAIDGSLAWWYVVASGVGAAGCLFAAMLVWSRRAALRRGEVAPHRPPTHRR